VDTKSWDRKSQKGVQMGNREARPPGRPPKETAEVPPDAVRFVEGSGQRLGQVARDLGLSAAPLQRWVQHANVEAGAGPAGALTKDERADRRRLRQEVKTRQLEREILQTAAAFAAKERR
jgi:transposase